MDSLPTVYVREGYHCDDERRRSVDDYIKLCKYYFPDVSVKDICNNMFKLLIKEKTYLRYCPNIRKVNFWGDYGWGNPVLAPENKWSRQGFSNCNLKLKEIN